LNGADAAARRAAGGGRGALVLVALAGVTATLVVAALFHAAEAQEQARRRDETVFAVRSLLQGDLLRVTTLVGGFAAWVEETGFDDPMAFEAYYLRATRYLDGTPWQAVAAVEVLPRSQLRARLAEVDERRILYDAARYPRLEVFPLSPAALAAPTLMVEPRSRRSRVFGFDIASDPIRLEHALEALETGRPVLTPPLVLSQDTDTPDAGRRRGVLLLAPVRRARERREDQRGVVAISFVPELLVADAIRRASGQPLDWQLSIEAATRDETEQAQRVQVVAVTSQLLHVQVLGQSWNVELAFPEDPSPLTSDTSLVVLLGLVATAFALALTYRKTGERERLRAALEERTRELEQTQEAIADAHRIDALGRLTGGVAHDFNNLLGVIAGNLDLLRDTLVTAPSPEEREGLLEFIDDASRATDRGARLTQKLLTLSRQAALHPEALDLDDVVREMAGVLRRTLPATLEISTRLAGDLPQLRADRVQLESALLNLAINARDAMPEGGRLTLATSLVPAPDDAEGEARPWVELSVTDTGTGMPPEVARRALDPFFTTKDVGRGTGLGLSIVAGFVAQSGGEVKVDSVEGQGTSIRLRFPAETTQTAALPDDGAQAWTPVAREGEVVVVVEDNAELRLVLDRQLRALGYEVRGAEDGRRGLDLVTRTQRVDLVLSDCVLPGDVDGFALARTLAARRPQLPVLLMSGYAEPPAPEQDPSAAAQIRLTKPIARAELAQAIRAAIDRRAH
jgi:signal transduction histidine kinase/ActR/RegA family two-component response regulator